MSNETARAASDAAAKFAEATIQFSELAKLFAEAAEREAAGRPSVDMVVFSAKMYGRARAILLMTRTQMELLARRPVRARQT